MDRQENDMEKMFQEKVAQRKANQEMTISEKMVHEELVEGKTDRQGNKWRKVYFGGGAHFRNWLAQ